MKLKWNYQDVATHLNGFLCVYKPKDMSLTALKRYLMREVSKAGNQLQHPPVPLIERPVVKPHPRSQALVVVGTRKQFDYSLHPLVYGMNFRPEDILLDELEPMEVSTSGVCLFAVNNGVEQLERVRELAWANEYLLGGVLGEESDKHKLSSKVIAKAKFEHVTQLNFEKRLTRLRHQYRRLSYELSNVDLHSEKAFEMASEGRIRPKILGTPLLYDIKLVKFQLPWFLLRLTAVCENDYFLRSLVHELGCLLGTVARPTRLTRLRIGPLQSQHALLDKYFQLPSVLKNIQMCNAIVKQYLNQERQDLMKSEDSAATVNYVEKFFLTSEHLQTARKQAVEDESCDHDALRILWGRDY